MTAAQAGFCIGFVVVFCLAIRGEVRFRLKRMLEAREAVDTAVEAAGVKREKIIEARSRRLIPVNKGYRAWFMYRVLNASGLDGVSRFIWRRRRNAWLIRGFFTRFR